jgi:hypothetical protein
VTRGTVASMRNPFKAAPVEYSYEPFDDHLCDMDDGITRLTEQPALWRCNVCSTYWQQEWTPPSFSWRVVARRSAHRVLRRAGCSY